VYPMLSLVTGDNEELNKLGGQSIATGKSKTKKERSFKMCCRICVSTDCICDLKWDYLNPPKIRDDKEMDALGKAGQSAVYNKFLRLTGSTLASTSKTLRTRDAEIFKQLKRHNIYPGENKLYQHFAWQNEQGVLSFHLALVPDILHTVLKGVVEYAIHWTWDILCCISKLDVYFATVCAEFDERISSFPFIQALRFFPNCRFCHGVSPFMKDSTNSSSGTSFSSGSLEAWKLQNLLLQMLFSIDGFLLPFTNGWINTNEIQCDYQWNVGRTVVHALTSVLEVVFCVKASRLKEDHLKSLHDMISSCRAHVMMLWCLRKDLILALAKKGQRIKSVPQAKQTLG